MTEQCSDLNLNVSLLKSRAFEYDVSVDEIKKISWDAYVATRGCGYTRADVRMDKETGKMYVLEINAQCGLSEDEDYTSIGAILRVSGVTYTQIIAEILNDALRRGIKKEKKVIRKKAPGKTNRIVSK